MGERGTARASAPACPRCGYDLTGEIATWSGPGAASCPVEGRCTECGLEFAWRDVLSTRFALPRGSVEHSDLGFLGARLLRAAGVTWVRTLLPWVLWTRLRLEHPIRWRRLVLVFALLALPGHALMMLVGAALGAVGADAVYTHGAWSGFLVDVVPETGVDGIDIALHALYGAAVPYHVAWYVAGFWMIAGLGAGAGLVANTLMGVSFLTLFQSLGRARVRRAHLVRGVAYGAGWSTGLCLAFTAVSSAVFGMNELGGSGLFFQQYFVGGVALTPAPAGPWYGDIVAFVAGGWGALAPTAWLVYGLQLLWLPVYWWCFTKRYLRLPHATSVVVAMLVITGLSMVTMAIVAGLMG